LARFRTQVTTTPISPYRSAMPIVEIVVAATRTQLYSLQRLLTMSRYVCHFSVNFSAQNIRSVLHELLESCQLELVYEVEDYLKAREIPGRVSFSRLVTAEILIDISTATPAAVKLSFVVKNEELPLNSNNHCRQVFDSLRLAISQDRHWQPISNLRSHEPFATSSILMPDASSAASMTVNARSAILN
jgi:hypothetical protein